MKYYHKISNILSNILLYLASLFIFAMLVIMLTEVVRRYIFGLTWMWSDEIIRTLLIYTAFFGGAAAYHKGSLANFDLLYTKLGAKPQSIATLIIHVISHAFLVFIFILSVRKVMNPSMYSQISVNTGLAIWTTYMSVPIGMGAMILFGFDKYPRIFRKIKEAYAHSKEGEEVVSE